MKLNLPTGEFDAHNALELARVAKLAYADPAPWGVIVSGRDAVFYFPGTRNLADVFTDLRFPRRPVGGGLPMPATVAEWRVHIGFLDAWHAVWSEVKARVIEENNGGQRIWLSAHSKGAGVALLSAVGIESLGMRIAGLYTFGEPRSGNAAWANGCKTLFPGRHFRVVHELDIIPRLPLWVAGNRHSPDLVRIEDDGSWCVNPNLPWQVAEDAFELGIGLALNKLTLPTLPGLRSLDRLAGDHHIDNYISPLEKAASKPAA